MKVTSNTEAVNAANSKVFSLVSNCNQFGGFLPEEVKDWESTEDYCKFSFQGLVTLTLRIVEKTEFSKVVFQAENDQNIPLSFSIAIAGDDSKCEVTVETEVNVPVMLSGMVKKPLQTFVDAVVVKIKEVAEK